MTRSSLATVEMLRLDDGRSLCVRRWAGTDDAPLVLLHGLLDSSEGWGPLCQRMRCTRIAIDLPGFGFSDPPVRGSIASYARDVAQALDAHGADRFTLIGHSLGGAVATAIADLMPHRVNGLVLLAPAGFGQIRLAEAVSLPGVNTLLKAVLPFALTSRTVVSAAYRTMVTNGQYPDPSVVSRLNGRGASLVVGACEGTRALVEAGRAAHAFHTRRVGYDGPVFAIWGERDRLVPPSHRHGVMKAFPQAVVDVWEGMGHHPVRERFDDLLELIGTAMRQEPARSAQVHHRAA